MLSFFESGLVRLQATDEGSGLKYLLDHLSTGCALSIRSASRTLYGLREVENKAFHTVYIPTPPRQEQCDGDLENVGQYCKHLIVRVAFPRKATRSASRHTKVKPVDRTIEGVLAESRHRQAQKGSRACLPPQQSASESPIAWQFLLQRRPSEINQKLLKQWLRVFSFFPNITTITLACNGDPAWPGCTDIEVLLITIRICIERINPSHLHTVHLNPIHAMGIMHFRWAGPGAYGEAPGSRNNVWQRVESLDVRVINPFIQERLSKSQQQTFKKVLHDYLQSFSRTLIKMKFCWLEDYGPDPFLPNIDGPAMDWPFLRELGIGRVTNCDTMIARMRGHAPALYNITGLVREHGDNIVGGLRDIAMWEGALETSKQGSEMAAASSLQVVNDMSRRMFGA